MIASTATISLLLCDLDGTLVDTMGGFADVAADVMQAWFGDDRAWARRRYLDTSGIPFAQQLELIHPGAADSERAVAEFEHRKLVVCRAANLHPATRRALGRLAHDGIRIGISSSAHQEHVDQFVARCDFPFALAFGSSVGFAKGKGHVAEACHRLGIERSRTAFVGDSLSDRDAALSTGIRFFALVGTLPRQSFLAVDPQCEMVTSFDELRERVVVADLRLCAEAG